VKGAETADLAALIQQVSQRSSTAFEALYDETSPALFSLLCRRLQSKERARDALQECYVKIWRHAGTFTPTRGPAMAWLFTMARHQACDLIRYQSSRPEVSVGEDGANAWEGVADSTRDVEREVETAQAMTNIRRAMSALSAGERQTISLVFLEELSIPEAAAALEVPLGTAKSWLRRGMIKLREACASPEASPMSLSIARSACA
jgi:RNA polymerase sigma-70 factor (ECF subfamily)